METESYMLHNLKRPVVVAMFGSAWQVIAGVLNITIFLRFTTIDIIGLYYTMNSMLVMSSIFEFGAPQAIIQWMSFRSGRRFSGGRGEARDVASLIQKCLTYYAIISLLFVTVSTLVMNYIVGGGSKIIWQWILISGLYCLSLTNQSLWQIAEGSGEVRSAYLNRLLRAIISSLALWGGLIGGLGIGALALSWGANAFMGWAQLWTRHGKLFHQWAVDGTDPHFRWSVEILPLQWRMGLVWSSGYFLHSVMNPIVYRAFGAEAAGRVGLCLSIANALVAFASLPILTSTFRFASMAASRQFHEFYKRLSLTSVIAVALYVSGAVFLFVLIDFLKVHGIGKFNRFGDLTILGLFLSFSLAYVLATPMLAYFRAFKKEPLWLISVSTNLSSGLLVWLASLRFPVEGVVLAYGMVITVSTIITALTFYFGKLRHELTMPI
jgi:hypothetical protein